LALSHPFSSVFTLYPEECTMPSSKQNPRDKQTGHTGKVENDTNKMGSQDPTQLNQGKRTPDSRSDREAHVGGGNQTQARRGKTTGH
jgi:hypothetical protein